MEKIKRLLRYPHRIKFLAEYCKEYRKEQKKIELGLKEREKKMNSFCWVGSKFTSFSIHLAAATDPPVIDPPRRRCRAAAARPCSQGEKTVWKISSFLFLISLTSQELIQIR